MTDNNHKVEISFSIPEVVLCFLCCLLIWKGC